MLRFLHAQAGLTTETGEIADIFKKYIFYGKPMDRDHLAEEMGDLLWYLSICCDLAGMNMEEIMRKNIFKLRLRYPACPENYYRPYQDGLRRLRELRSKFHPNTLG